MTESFVHLHVASGYSMRYGTAKPGQLVERARAWGQPALALTDRDGLYGAVKFVKACMAQDMAPILGVDLALGSESGPVTRARSSSQTAPMRAPVRGGAVIDPRLPRVTVLARGSRPGSGSGGGSGSGSGGGSGGAGWDPDGGLGLAPGAGWAALCRLVTATHLRGDRGTPVTTTGLIAEHARREVGEFALTRPGAASSGPVGPAAAGERAVRAGPGEPTRRHTATASGRAAGVPAPLVVLLGPDSDVGRAVLAKQRTAARALLERWVELLPRGAVVVEIVCHGGPEHLPGSLQGLGNGRGLRAELGQARAEGAHIGPNGLGADGHAVALDVQAGAFQGGVEH